MRLANKSASTGSARPADRDKCARAHLLNICPRPTAAETVQLALKSLGWRGVPGDFRRPPTCPQSMHPSLCITCGRIFMLETCNATKTQQRRGFHRGAFGYNESPTSSCHTILLEGASLFGRAFFLVSTQGASAYSAPLASPPLRVRAERQARHHDLAPDRSNDPHGSHQKLLDHCPHRPRQEHAGRPDHPALRRPVGPRDGRPGARFDGHRTRARHHDQGADRGARIHGQGRQGLQPQPDRHAGARRLLVRSQPLVVGVRRRVAGGRREPGRRGADGGQLLHRARAGRRGGAGPEQDGPAQRGSGERQEGDRGRHRHRRHRRDPVLRQDRHGHRRDPRGRDRPHAAAQGRARRAAARDDHRQLVRQLRRRRDAGARGRRRAAARTSACA